MVMPADLVLEHEPGIGNVSDQPWPTSSFDVQTIVIEVSRNYLTWEDDPVLAELWDNPEDAAAFND